MASDQILAVFDRYDKIIIQSKDVKNNYMESNNLFEESNIIDLDNLLNISENNTNINLIDSCSKPLKEQDERSQLEEVLNTWSQQEPCPFQQHEILKPQMLDDISSENSGNYNLIFY